MRSERPYCVLLAIQGPRGVFVKTILARLRSLIQCRQNRCVDQCQLFVKSCLQSPKSVYADLEFSSCQCCVAVSQVTETFYLEPFAIFLDYDARHGSNCAFMLFRRQVAL